MDTDLLYKSLIDMGFSNDAIQDAINYGNTSMDSALNFLTNIQCSNQPLTFQQASNTGGVLKLGRRNDANMLSDAAFPFSKPIEMAPLKDTNLSDNDIASSGSNQEETIVKSRYQKSFKESIIEKEQRMLIKEIKEDKERKSKVYQDTLKAIHDDRQAIKDRAMNVDTTPSLSSASNTKLNKDQPKPPIKKDNNLCRLKIMIPHQSPFLLQIENSTSLGLVVSDLCNQRSLSFNSISLLSQFPKREFNPNIDYEKSLIQLQLHPSATLMCKISNPTEGESNTAGNLDENKIEISSQNMETPIVIADPPLPVPMEEDANEEDMENIQAHPHPMHGFPNLIPHGHILANEEEFVPFQGSGHQLIPQNPDIAPIYHNRRPRELAGTAALDRLSTDRHRVPPLSQPAATCSAFIQPPRLVDLCNEHAVFHIRKSNRYVIDNVRLLPELYAHVLIERLIKDMLFTPQIAKLFKDCITRMDLGCKPLVTNSMLKTIALYWKRLKTLILDGVDAMFTDEGLWELKELPNLQHLSLKSCKKITDYGLQVIAFLPHLNSLSIRSTHVTDTGFTRLRETLTREPSNNPIGLSQLDLAGLDITCISLECLANFSSLNYLDLSRTQISDPLLLPELSNLRHLNISHCPNLKLSPASLQNLNQLHSLQELKCRGLHNICLTDFIIYLKERRLVNIDGVLESANSVTTEHLRELSDFPLDTLELESCHWLTDDCLQEIGRISTLTRLSISNCHFITLAGLLHLVSLEKLESLSLIGLQGIKEKDYAFVVPQFSSSLFNIIISGISECEQKELMTRISRRCKYKFSCNARCFPIPNQAL